MQRLLSSSLLSKRFTNSCTSSLLHSQPHNYFASLPNPKNFLLQSHPFLSSYGKCPIRRSHSYHPHLNVKGSIFPWFRPNPSLPKQFSSNSRNAHFREASGSLVRRKAGVLEARFARGYRGFDRGLRSSGRDWRLWFQQLTPNDMVLGLIMANAAVFMLWQIADRRFMVENFMISLDNFRSGRIHTLITSAFSHMDIEHLLSNMIGLYFFGVNIAENFGPKYLLKLYLCGAVGGSVLYLLHHYLMALSSKEQGIWKRDPSRTPGLGASGAVNAIMLLEIFLNPRATIMFDFIIPVPAMLLGVFLIGKDVWRIVQGDSNISGSAHLGGAAVAGLAWYQIRRGRF
ncbi:unnamed protein product [Linum tenue]|uniref:Peptidase S54 rhomboid domain-containing protein n=1 Tax=Linum tenue TaxID=586396 RepID=A0AAV0RVX0_9ROSI|nr:unnamed protein product [Linum tenue]